MISRGTYLGILTSILFVGTILIVVYQTSVNESSTLRITASKGQTIEELGRVVLPGAEMDPGSIYRVMGSQLALSGSNPQTRIVFQASSRFQRAPAPGTHDYHLIHHSGIGSSQTRTSTIVHTWSGVGSSGAEPRLIQKSGIAEWEIRSDRIHLSLGEDFVGHWSFQNQVLNLANAAESKLLSVERTNIKSLSLQEKSPKLFKPRPASMISPQELIDWISSWKGQGGTPSSLRQVTGHWIRDHWGNVYLYRPGDSGGFTLRSSGPDEMFVTDDDKRWKVAPGG